MAGNTPSAGENCGSNCANQCYGYCGDTFDDDTTSKHTGCGTSGIENDCTMYCAMYCYQGCDGGCTGCGSGCADSCTGGCSETCSGACKNTCKDNCNAGCDNSTRFEDLILNKKFIAKDMSAINSAIEFEATIRRDKDMIHNIDFSQKDKLNYSIVNQLIENFTVIKQIEETAIQAQKANKFLPQKLIDVVKEANQELIPLP